MLKDGSGSADRTGREVNTATAASSASAVETDCAVDLAGTPDGVGLLSLNRLDAADLASLGRRELLGVLGDIQRFVNQATGYRAKVLGALELLEGHGRVPEASPHIALREATGVSERDARRITRTADKAREHETVLQSLSQGNITPDQAEVLCDARVPNAVRQELLAAAALEDSDQTRQRVHQAQHSNETAMQRFRRQREARGAGWRRDHEGMLKLWAKFDPRSGAQVQAVLDTLQQQYWINDKQVRSNRRSPAQRDADVLAHAIASLTYNKADEDAIERQTNRNHDGAAPHLPTAQVSVLIDLDALRKQTDAMGVTDAGIELPSEVVRGLACDAEIIPIILGGPGGSPDIGRLRRTVSPRLRRMLIASDRHCQWPGCDQPPSRCDAHHVIHWADGGPTNLDNLVLLCHRHHHGLHEHGHQITRQPDGTWNIDLSADKETNPDPKHDLYHSTKQARGP